VPPFSHFDLASTRWLDVDWQAQQVDMRMAGRLAVSWFTRWLAT
jgi:hypothetical protein